MWKEEWASGSWELEGVMVGRELEGVQEGLQVPAAMGLSLTTGPS